jgi:integrase
MSRSRAQAIEATHPRPSFGSIEPRPKAMPISFRTVYRIDGAKQTKTFDTYTQAYDFLEEQGQAIRKGRQPSHLTKARTPWSTVAWAWYAERHPDQSASKGREYYALKKFEESFGRTPIGAITRADVQRWINGMGIAPKTVGDYYQVIGQQMRMALLDGYLPNGAPLGKGLHKLPTVAKRMVFLTEKQLAHLLKVCQRVSPAHCALVHLVAHTGLRQGEALGLTRNRYNSIGAVLLVQQSAKKRTRTLGTTKTNRHRSVALWPCCVQLLNDHLAGHEHDLIFPDRGGRIVGADNWRSRVWDPLVEAAGFADLGLHFHDLRHTHTTHLLESGWDPTAVAERLGHASTKMTLDVYGHTTADRQKELLAKMWQEKQRKRRA